METYTDSDLELLVSQYFKDPDNAKKLAETGLSPYNEEDMFRIAEELRLAICEAYRNHQTRFSSPLTDNMKKIKITSYERKDGTAKLTIHFPLSVLARPSLFSDAKYSYNSVILGRNHRAYTSSKISDAYFTGEQYHNSHSDRFEGLSEMYGVYDIIGLMTQGYSIKGSAIPRGEWVGIDSTGARYSREPNYYSWVARKSLSPSGFIKNAIDTFKQRYPAIEITFPTLWGGNA